MDPLPLPPPGVITPPIPLTDAINYVLRYSSALAAQQDPIINDGTWTWRNIGQASLFAAGVPLFADSLVVQIVSDGGLDPNLYASDARNCDLNIRSRIVDYRPCPWIDFASRCVTAMVKIDGGNIGAGKREADAISFTLL